MNLIRLVSLLLFFLCAPQVSASSLFEPLDREALSTLVYQKSGVAAPGQRHEATVTLYSGEYVKAGNCWEAVAGAPGTYSCASGLDNCDIAIMDDNGTPGDTSDDYYVDPFDLWWWLDCGSYAEFELKGNTLNIMWVD